MKNQTMSSTRIGQTYHGSSSRDSERMFTTGLLFNMRKNDEILLKRDQIKET